jgi:uncharacterized damage-inducible protein DinB
MKKWFVYLYQYDAWANKRVVECLSRQNVKDKKILGLMAHVLVAHLVWLHRIKDFPPPDLQLWGDYELKQLVTMSEQASDQWLQFLNGTDDFSRQMTYKSTAGTPFTSTLEMIITHVANHATYHRAQIAILLPPMGLKAVNTDFITYDRMMTGQLKEP